MPELKACIFDMDGVIVNSAEFHFTAWRRIASDLAIDLNDDFEIQLKGISRVDSLEKTEITHFFDEIIDGNKVKLSKPDPEVFLRGATGLGCDPSNCLVFEDAVSGVTAAKAGGFFSIAIGDKKDFPHADHVINGLHELNLAKLKEIFSKHD